MVELTKELLEKEYCSDLLTQKEICRKYGVSYQKIRRLIKKYNIPTIYNRLFRKRSDISPTPEQLQVIIGTLLGDGTIQRKGSSKFYSYRLSVSHSVKQAEYLIWKAGILHSLIPRNPPYVITRKYPKSPAFKKKIYYGLQFTTMALPCFEKLWFEFYSSGKKRVTKSTLDMLSPLGLAIWFMDDGRYHGSGLEICGVWDRSEQSDILNYFKKDYPSVKILDHFDSLREQFISFRKDDAEKFATLILPHLHRTLYYKIQYIKTESSEIIRQALPRWKKKR